MKLRYWRFYAQRAFGIAAMILGGGYTTMMAAAIGFARGPIPSDYILAMATCFAVTMAGVAVYFFAEKHPPHIREMTRKYLERMDAERAARNQAPRGWTHAG